MLVPFGAGAAILDRPHVTWAWLGLLLFSVGVAVVTVQWLYLAAVRRVGPARAASYTYLEPFLTVAVAWLLIGERVLPLQILGGVVILLGLLIGRPGPLGTARPTTGGGIIAQTGESSG